MIVMQGPLGEESCQNAFGKECWNTVERVLCRAVLGEERCREVLRKSGVEQRWEKSPRE